MQVSVFVSTKIGNFFTSRQYMQMYSSVVVLVMSPTIYWKTKIMPYADMLSDREG